MARKPPKGKSLAEVNPELAKQWHPTKNGELTPCDVSAGSHVKVWWKCDKGDDHEWQSVIYSRLNSLNCPICVGQKAVKSNCLATLNPILSKDWHPTKNGKLTPSDFTTGSGKKVWWKCDRGGDHEWIAGINKRSNGRGCPICTGKKVVFSNCLKTTNPNLAKDWHPTKNGILTPYDVGDFSNKKVWWKCDKGDDHEWESLISSRSHGCGCPICDSKKIVLSNCLETTNPNLTKQWHPTKNGILTPYDVGDGSNKKVWWKCDKGDDHEWESSINSRSQGNGCPVCSNQKVVSSNCLKITNPKLAKQWHPTKNGNLTPYNVTAGSGKIVWWKCDKGIDHEWNASSGQRVGKDTGCPFCAEYGFNRSKDALFYIRKINLDNSKQALKFGITNNMDGDREKQQQRHVEGSVDTILREEVAGEIALDIENLCKKYFGRKGFLTAQEFPDGFSETIKYSEESIQKIKSIVDEVLTEKAEKKK